MTSKSRQKGACILHTNVISLLRLAVTCWCFPAALASFSNQVTTEVPLLQFDHVTVATKQGAVKGFLVTQNQLNVDDHAATVVARFLGIPYALPPVGDLRYQKPRRHPGWTARNGPLEAFYPPPACPGLAEHANTVERFSTDEDCLYLNVYVTRNLSAVEHVNILQLPVVVFLGRQSSNFEEQIFANGWRDVIIVTIQNRLGVFGFFSFGSDSPLDGLGNVGFKDQRLALHWVWDNVREFGGNPDHITLVGSRQSDISYHLISLQSRGLFRTAVLRDSTSLSVCCASIALAQQMALQLAKDTKCPTEPADATIRCLKKVPAVELWQAAAGIESSFKKPWTPIIDGDFLTKSPREALKDNNVNGASLLLGISSRRRREAFEFFQSDENIKLNNLNSITLTSSLEVLIKKRVALAQQQQQQRKQEQDTAVDRAVRICQLEYHDNCVADFTDSLVNAYNDITFSLTAYLLAMHYSRNSQNVYLYNIAIDDDAVDEENIETALRWEHETWMNFVKKGDPNQDVPDMYWSPYNEKEQSFVTFTPRNKVMSLHSHFKQRQMMLWAYYLPSVLQYDDSSLFCADVVQAQNGSSVIGATQLAQSHVVIVFVLAGLIVCLIVISIVLCCKLSQAQRSDYKKGSQNGWNKNRRSTNDNVNVPYRFDTA